MAHLFIIQFLLSVTLFLGSTSFTFAQDQTLIVGEWVYSEPIGKETMDAKTQDMMNSFFATMWFSFHKDGTYDSSAMGKEESGTWTMNPEGTLITLTPNEGVAQEITVISVDETTWLMEISKGKGFKMVHGARKVE